MSTDETADLGPGIDAPGPDVPATGTADPDAPGTAGPDGERRRRPGLSPSRANDYLQCPLLFRLRVVDRLPEPPSPAAVRGTLVHAVLERLFDLPVGSRTREAAVAALPAAWQSLVDEAPERAQVLPDGGDLEPWFAPARDLLATYFTLEDPNRLQPAEREMCVSLALEEDLELRGIIDRVDVAPDGAVRLVDYKTGRSPRAGYEAGALFQMRFYALLLARLRGRVPAMLQLIYLGDGVVVRHEPDEAELASTERRLRAIWSSVQTSAREGTWTPKRGPLCGWCAHQAVCPEFGGTPPEVDPDRVEVTIGVRPQP